MSTERNSTGERERTSNECARSDDTAVFVSKQIIHVGQPILYSITVRYLYFLKVYRKMQITLIWPGDQVINLTIINRFTIYYYKDFS